MNQLQKKQIQALITKTEKYKNNLYFFIEMLPYLDYNKELSIWKNLYTRKEMSKYLEYTKDKKKIQEQTKYLDTFIYRYGAYFYINKSGYIEEYLNAYVEIINIIKKEIGDNENDK